MKKYDPIKMIELVKIEDPDSDGGLTLVFIDNSQIRIKAINGKLVSEVIQ